MALILTTQSEAFNKELKIQGGAICGEIVARAQLSQKIRPYTETFANNSIYPKGEIQSLDLLIFKDLPDSIRSEVVSATKNEAAYLYEFRHFPQKSKKVIHGYLLTRKRGPHQEKHLVENFFVTGKSKESKEVIMTIVKAFE